MKTVTCEDFRKEWLDATRKEDFHRAPPHIREHWQQCVACQQEWFWWQEYRPYVHQVFLDEERDMARYTVASKVMTQIKAADQKAGFFSGLFGGFKSMQRLSLTFTVAFMLIFVFIFTQSTFVPIEPQHQPLQAFAGQQLALGGISQGMYAIGKQGMVASIGEPLTLIDSNTGTGNTGLILSLLGMVLITLSASWLTRKLER
jgi:hypothetical protein